MEDNLQKLISDLGTLKGVINGLKDATSDPKTKTIFDSLTKEAETFIQTAKETKAQISEIEDIRAKSAVSGGNVRSIKPAESQVSDTITTSSALLDRLVKQLTLVAQGKNVLNTGSVKSDADVLKEMVSELKGIKSALPSKEAFANAGPRIAQVRPEPPIKQTIVQPVGNQTQVIITDSARRGAQEIEARAPQYREGHRAISSSTGSVLNQVLGSSERVDVSDAALIRSLKGNISSHNHVRNEMLPSLEDLNFWGAVKPSQARISTDFGATTVTSKNNKWYTEDELRKAYESSHNDFVKSSGTNPSLAKLSPVERENLVIQRVMEKLGLQTGFELSGALQDEGTLKKTLALRGNISTNRELKILESDLGLITEKRGLVSREQEPLVEKAIKDQQERINLHNEESLKGVDFSKDIVKKAASISNPKERVAFLEKQAAEIASSAELSTTAATKALEIIYSTIQESANILAKEIKDNEARAKRAQETANKAKDGSSGGKKGKIKAEKTEVDLLHEEFTSVQDLINDGISMGASDEALNELRQKRNSLSEKIKLANEKLLSAPKVSTEEPEVAWIEGEDDSIDTVISNTNAVAKKSKIPGASRPQKVKVTIPEPQVKAPVAETLLTKEELTARKADISEKIRKINSQMENPKLSQENRDALVKIQAANTAKYLEVIRQLEALTNGNTTATKKETEAIKENTQAKKENSQAANKTSIPVATKQNKIPVQNKSAVDKFVDFILKDSSTSSLAPVNLSDINNTFMDNINSGLLTGKFTLPGLPPNATERDKELQKLRNEAYREAFGNLNYNLPIEQQVDPTKSVEVDLIKLETKAIEQQTQAVKENTTAKKENTAVTNKPSQVKSSMQAFLDYVSDDPEGQEKERLRLEERFNKALAGDRRIALRMGDSPGQRAVLKEDALKEMALQRGYNLELTSKGRTHDLFKITGTGTGVPQASAPVQVPAPVAAATPPTPPTPPIPPKPPVVTPSPAAPVKISANTVIISGSTPTVQPLPGGGPPSNTPPLGGGGNGPSGPSGPGGPGGPPNNNPPDDPNDNLNNKRKQLRALLRNLNKFTESAIDNIIAQLEPMLQEIAALGNDTQITSLTGVRRIGTDRVHIGGVGLQDALDQSKVVPSNPLATKIDDTFDISEGMNKEAYDRQRQLEKAILKMAEVNAREQAQLEEGFNKAQKARQDFDYAQMYDVAKGEMDQDLKEREKQRRIRGTGYAEAFRENERRNRGIEAANDPTLRPAFAAAAQQGFRPQDLHAINTEGKRGVRELRFQREDELTGVMHRFNTTITRTGDLLPEVGRKFRTFGDGVLRDISEMTKWSIAMAIIYAPLQKLAELTSLMIDNQTRLAAATVAVNDKFTTQEQIFNAASKAANNAGQDINETIDAFTQAYRATGGGLSATERFTVAQTLLGDAMTLAKLSGIDEATAIDTLSAALRQTGTALDQGATLLDKWVKTSQVANVDIATLATGFAVMGDTAAAAGLSIDQLNGLVATVAETGLASGKEAANAARRLVEAYQTPGAIQALHSLGIATEDSSGKAREFLDITKQIFEMRQGDNPLISKEKFSEFTLIAGQGQRGQAALSAVISNAPRLDQITQASASTQGGEAAKAMETQLGTVQTAVTRLNNAFQQLAQTMGTKGGFLELFTAGANAATAFLNAINSLASGMGKSFPIMVALTGALVAFYRKPAETRAMYARNADSMISGFLDKFGGQAPSPMVGQQGQLFSQTSGGGWNYRPSAGRSTDRKTYFEGAGRGYVGGTAGFGAMQGVATGLIPSIAHLVEGDNQAALASMGGAIAGGVIGNLVAPGVGGAIGAPIGVAIAETFLALTKGKIGDDSTGLGPVFTGQYDKDISPESIAKDLSDKQRTAYKESLKKDVLESQTGYNIFGGLAQNVTKTVLQANLDLINDYIKKGDKESIRKMYTKGNPGYGSAEILSGLGYTEQMAYALFETDKKTAGQFEPITDLQAAVAAGGNRESALDLSYIASTEQGSNSVAGEITPAVKAALSIRQDFGAIVSELIAKETRDIINKRSSGEIKTSEFLREQNKLKDFDPTGYQVLASLSGKVDVDMIKRLLEVFTYGAEEATTEIINLAGSVSELQDALGKETNFDKRAKLVEDIQNTQGALESAILQSSVDIGITKNPMIRPVNSESTPYTSGDVSKIVPLAQQLQLARQRASGWDDVTIKRFNSNLDDLNVVVKDTGDAFYKVLKELSPEAWAEAVKVLTELGELSTQSSGTKANVDFQQFKDVDRATLENAARQSISLNTEWKTKFGYTGSVDQQIAIAKNGVASPLKADFKILAMLLEKLVDQGQKQLDGMYNLPDGASFWVNLAAARLDLETRAGITSGGGGDTTPITTGPGSYIGTPDVLPKVTTSTMPQTKQMEYWQVPGQHPWGSIGKGFGKDNIFIDSNASPNAFHTPYGMENNWTNPFRTPYGMENNYKPKFKDSNKGGFQTPYGMENKWPGPTYFGEGMGKAPGASGDLVAMLPNVLTNAISSIQFPAQKLENVITQNLAVRMTSTTNLIVDGRILATVIKPYLANDMNTATSTVNFSQAAFTI